MEVDSGVTLDFDGPGVTNLLRRQQVFIALADTTGMGPGQIIFENNAKAGDLGEYQADQSLDVGRAGGAIIFRGHSSAGSSFFFPYGGTSTGKVGGNLTFSQSSTAANSYILVGSGTGGGADAVVNFSDESEGGEATVVLGQTFGNPMVDLSQRTKQTFSIGAISGLGTIFLGQTALTIGGNNATTVLSAALKDGGPGGGTGGRLIKIGTGTLTLNARSTYTGGTQILDGQLLVNASTGSTLGRGDVSVDGGILGGSGQIFRSVTVSDGSADSAAMLSPGSDDVGQLVISQRSIFFSNGSYICSVDSGSATADSVTAAGVTIAAGAQLDLHFKPGGVIPAGTVFEVIGNPPPRRSMALLLT